VSSGGCEVRVIGKKYFSWYHGVMQACMEVYSAMSYFTACSISVRVLIGCTLLRRLISPVMR
jgi:hypothetical protein